MSWIRKKRSVKFYFLCLIYLQRGKKAFADIRISENGWKWMRMDWNRWEWLEMNGNTRVVFRSCLSICCFLIITWCLDITFFYFSNVIEFKIELILIYPIVIHIRSSSIFLSPKNLSLFLFFSFYKKNNKSKCRCFIFSNLCKTGFHRINFRRFATRL